MLKNSSSTKSRPLTTKTLSRTNHTGCINQLRKYQHDIAIKMFERTNLISFLCKNTKDEYTKKLNYKKLIWNKFINFFVHILNPCNV